jgi:electron transport complex protein RnfC
MFGAKHLNSIHAGHYKNTAGCATEVMPVPNVVKISMSQNIGAPCKPLVKKGDSVLVGQKIGDTDAFLHVPVHSSVSGVVTGIETITETRSDSKPARIFTLDGREVKNPQRGIYIINGKKVVIN